MSAAMFSDSGMTLVRLINDDVPISQVVIGMYCTSNEAID